MDVRTVCLGVLTLGDATGYEIRKMFEEGPFQYFTDAGFGSIYPALNKLNTDGLVTCEQQSQSGKPDKKIYSITDKGRETFAAEILRAPGNDKFRSDFLLMMFFEHLLPPSMLADVIDERIEWYRQKIEMLRSCDCSGWGAGPIFVNRFGQAVYSAALKYLETSRDDLVDATDENSNEQAAE